ncbi:ROK family transcriptional regulator [Actinopolymorpha sp. B11F2]|uniref:ROK family transcriptional regulator n=1 Tax=Actinopolymorpha sp. B11F2 TaxID=3160862 RepID=UPI0032E4AD6F
MVDLHARKRNRALVLGTLRTDAPLSKAEIGRRLGLSVPTITEILGEFEADGVVAAVGEGPSSGGRRPMLYGLRTHALRAVGVSVDPDRITAVVSDLSGDISTEAARAIDLADGDRAFVDALASVIDHVLTADAPERLAGIGIAVPTMMRRSQKGRFTPLGHPHWKDVDLLAVLGERYGLPIVTENRAHAVGVGEYLFGAGRGTPDLLCLMLGSGLGAAILAGGELFTGGDGGAGALGRLLLEVPGRGDARSAPTVGGRVGADGIAGTAADRLRATGRETHRGVPITELDIDHVIDAAVDGDALMAEVLADVGRILGAVVATTLCVTDSDLVLLCGQTMRAGPLIVDPLRDALESWYPFALPRLRVGQLGVHAGPLGAAALVLTNLVREAPLPGREVTR